MKHFCYAMAVCMLSSATMLFAGPTPDLDAEHLALQSRLRVLGHGYYDSSYWTETLDQLDALKGRAERAGRTDLLVDVALMKSQVYSAAQQDYPKSLDVLRRARNAYDEADSRQVRKLYVEESRVLAQMGDEEAVAKLIEIFRQSSHYDPEEYSFRVGQGRNTPMEIVRPGAGSGASTTVTAMESYRKRARFAPGNFAPEVTGQTMAGGEVRLSDYRGRVVLVDIWLMNAETWKRDLPRLREVYAAHRGHGFEVLGVCLNRQTGDIGSFAREHRMDWPQLTRGAAIGAQFAVYGEAHNFLVDGDGMIMGRDLDPQDLSRALGDIYGETQ